MVRLVVSIGKGSAASKAYAEDVFRAYLVKLRVLGNLNTSLPVAIMSRGHLLAIRTQRDII